jgi:hypothetical protein
VAGALATYPVKEYIQQFDRLTTRERVASSAPSWTPAVPEAYKDHTYVLGDFARRVGHRVETSHAVPGGFVDVILLWEVLKIPTKDYTVSPHLYADGQMWGQQAVAPRMVSTV